jgi:excisionase family DNA binding protein
LCENSVSVCECDIAEVAEHRRSSKLLGLHRNTVYRRISDGSLPAVRLGEHGPLRVDAAELEDWLAANPAVPREETNERV